MTDQLEPDAITQALLDAEDDMTVPSGDKLQAVEHWIKRQVALEDLKESLENRLKQCNKDLEAVQDKHLPDALMAAGCQKFKTTGGLQVGVEAIYYASTTKEDAPKFYDWLDDNGSSGIVNTVVTLELGKGTHGAAKELIAQLNYWLSHEKMRTWAEDWGVNPAPQLSESIHWATLRAFAKEQVQADNELPEYLKVHHVNRAKIKRP